MVSGNICRFGFASAAYLVIAIVLFNDVIGFDRRGRTEHRLSPPNAAVAQAVTNPDDRIQAVSFERQVHSATEPPLIRRDGDDELVGRLAAHGVRGWGAFVVVSVRRNP